MSNLKKILALVLALVMSLSLVTVASAYKDDADVSETYEEAITVLTELGVFEGEGGSFYPQRSITRAETAAILYRIVTGDVNDEQDHIYSDYMKFSDTYQSMWYAGYIGYCSNAELIKGYGGNKFGPQDNVTGYQALAMILRAIGYGQKGEFQGTGWEVKVASTAKEIGILDNIKESTLGKAATREMVAEMLYQGILVDQVVYSSNREGYVTLPGAKSIAEETFKLSASFADENVWGQPSKCWTFVNQAKETKKIEIPYKALGYYTTAVTECDLVEETGVKGTVDVWTNGNKVADDTSLSATAIRDTIGAQGRQTYVYKDRIVYIDTFLAQVTDVTEVKYDAKGHIARQALLELTVYNNVRNGQVVYLTSDSNWTYAEGEMLLVNAVTDANSLAVATTATRLNGYTKLYEVAKHLEIVQAAESFVGAQTTIWTAADRHTIDGKEYNDAVRFYLDRAGNDTTVRFTWWMDQFGNLIGATPIERTSYAVLKDMIWISGTPGYAQATLIDMNGTESTVTVNRIDGFSFNSDAWTVDQAIPELRDANNYNQLFNSTRCFVSTNSNYNAGFNGYALFAVRANDDGTVDLEGWNDDTTPDTIFIDYEDDAILNIDASAIQDNAGNALAFVSSNTKFIVNNGDGTYSAYTGTANLPDFAEGSVEVFYSAPVDGNFTMNVYIKSFVPQAALGTHLFTTTKTTAYTVASGVYTMTVVVDGAERQIQTRDAALVRTLVNNTGKLFHPTWQTNEQLDDYGFLTNVALVSETADNEPHCDYIRSEDATLNGTAISYTKDHNTLSSRSYNLTYATTVVCLDGTRVAYDIEAIKDALENLEVGIWVVSDDAPYNKATTVYIGTRLEEINTISVKGETGLVVPNAPTGNTYKVNIIDKNNDGALDLTVDMNAVSQFAYYTVQKNSEAVSAAKTGPYTLENVKKGETYTVTVYTECAGACSAEVWTIEVGGWDIISDAVSYIRNGQNNAELAKNIDVYYDFADAVKSANVVSLKNDNHYTNAKFVLDTAALTNSNLEIVRFTNEAPTLKGFEDANATVVTVSGGSSADYQIDDLASGTIVVVKLTSRGDNAPVYFAFRVNNNNI